MRSATYLLVTVFLAIASVAGAAESEDRWDLSDIEEINIDGVSGDIIIVAADGKEGFVELHSNVRPDDGFEPRVKRQGGALKIKEKWHGSSSGRVTWTIYLPKDDDAPSKVSVKD